MARAERRGSAAERSCSAEMHAGERTPMPLVSDRPAWLEALCARTSGQVAHLGCTDSPYTEQFLDEGTLLHARLARVASVTGWDVDFGALALLRRQMPDARFVEADVAAGVPDGERRRYALVIAGEVLEHVPDAQRFLTGCRELLAPGGRLCVTVPNACSPKIGLRALAGRESVHPDHRVYYGPRTLRRTLSGAGLDTEWLASCFVSHGRMGAVLNPLLRLSHRAFAGPVGEGLIALASRSEAAVSPTGRGGGDP